MIDTLYLEKDGRIAAVGRRTEQGFSLQPWGLTIPDDPHAVQRLLRPGVVARFGWDGGDVKVPPARFKSLRDVGKHLFEIVPDKNGTYTLRNVPIFKTHQSSVRGYNADEAFLDRMVKNHYAMESATKEVFGSGNYGWLPKFHFGHTPTDGNIREEENAGFIRHLYRVENFLFADVIGLDKDGLSKLCSGKYPDRSPEIDTSRARLLSSAFLGARAPHFGLPQMRPDTMAHVAEAIAKHQRTLGIDTPVVRGEAFNFEGRTMNASKKVEALRADEFLAQLAIDSELTERFEQAKDDAIARYMDEKGEKPGLKDIQGIIKNVIATMIGKKINNLKDEEGTRYQRDASELIDLEGPALHKKEDDDDDDDDDSDCRHSFGWDTDDNAGEPEEGDTDGVTRSVAGAMKTVRHSLKKVPAAQREPLEAAFGEITKLTEALGGMVAKYSRAVVKLDKHNKALQQENDRSACLSEIESIRRDGFSSVGDAESVKRCLKFALSLSPEQRKEYFTQLRSAPKVNSGSRERFTKRECVSPGGTPKTIEDAVDAALSDKTMRHAAHNLGITRDAAVAAEIWGQMEGDDETEE